MPDDRLRLRIVCLTATLVVSLQVVLSAQPTADLEAFEKEVRPLLIESCGKCHGAEKQKAGLGWTLGKSSWRGASRGLRSSPAGRTRVC